MCRAAHKGDGGVAQRRGCDATQIRKVINSMLKQVCVQHHLLLLGMVRMYCFTSVDITKQNAGCMLTSDSRVPLWCFCMQALEQWSDQVICSDQPYSDELYS